MPKSPYNITRQLAAKDKKEQAEIKNIQEAVEQKVDDAALEIDLTLSKMDYDIQYKNEVRAAAADKAAKIKKAENTIGWVDTATNLGKTAANYYKEYRDNADKEEAAKLNVQYQRHMLELDKRVFNAKDEAEIKGLVEGPNSQLAQINNHYTSGLRSIYGKDAQQMIDQFGIKAEKTKIQIVRSAAQNNKSRQTQFLRQHLSKVQTAVNEHGYNSKEAQLEIDMYTSVIDSVANSGGLSGRDREAWKDNQLYVLKSSVLGSQADRYMDTHNINKIKGILKSENASKYLSPSQMQRMEKMVEYYSKESNQVKLVQDKFRAWQTATNPQEKRANRQALHEAYGVLAPKNARTMLLLEKEGALFAKGRDTEFNPTVREKLLKDQSISKNPEMHGMINGIITGYEQMKKGDPNALLWMSGTGIDRNEARLLNHRSFMNSEARAITANALGINKDAEDNVVLSTRPGRVVREQSLGQIVRQKGSPGENSYVLRQGLGQIKQEFGTTVGNLAETQALSLMSDSTVSAAAAAYNKRKGKLSSEVNSLQAISGEVNVQWMNSGDKWDQRETTAKWALQNYLDTTAGKKAYQDAVQDKNGKQFLQDKLTDIINDDMKKLGGTRRGEDALPSGAGNSAVISPDILKGLGPAEQEYVDGRINIAKKQTSPEYWLDPVRVGDLTDETQDLLRQGYQPTYVERPDGGLDWHLQGPGGDKVALERRTVSGRQKVEYNNRRMKLIEQRNKKLKEINEVERYKAKGARHQWATNLRPRYSELERAEKEKEVNDTFDTKIRALRKEWGMENERGVPHFTSLSEIISHKGDAPSRTAMAVTRGKKLLKGLTTKRDKLLKTGQRLEAKELAAAQQIIRSIPDTEERQRQLEELDALR